MKKKISQLNVSGNIRCFVQQCISYGIIGMFSASVDTAIFCCFIYIFNINRYFANLISVHIGMLCSFFLNRHFTFKSYDSTIRRFFFFYCTGLFGVVLSQIFLWTGNLFKFNILYAKIFSVFIVALIQFLINRKFAFGG